MQIHVTSTLGDLERDLKQMATTTRPKLAAVVERNADHGVRLARQFAVRSAGTHGKHYPNSINAEPRGPLTWLYGPDPGKLQGGMSFERGSRNQPPHLDLARSADVIGPQFAKDAADVLDDLFWPGAS